MSRSYRQIKGTLYDRNLLNKVKQFVAGQGDGRISKSDAENLWLDTRNSMKATKVERRTIHYIIKSYRLTPPAKSYLKKQLYLTYNVEELTELARYTGYKKWGIHGISFDGIVPTDIQNQEKISGNIVNYPTAVAAMFEALLQASSDANTPFAVVSNIYGITDEAEIQKILKIHLSNCISHLLPISSTIKKITKQITFPTPKNREPAQKNWIFYLQIPTLSEHHWWVVVPRNGNAAYTYGLK